MNRERAQLSSSISCRHDVAAGAARPGRLTPGGDLDRPRQRIGHWLYVSNGFTAGGNEQVPPGIWLTHLRFA